MNAAEKVIAGAHVLSEWLGEGGKPVPHEIAQSRAETCLICPKNARHTLWHMLEAPVAGTILRLIEVKNDMQLTVEGEAQLGTCRVCLCLLPLKVHAPIRFIAGETDEETLKEFPPGCWVKREIGELPS